MLASTSHKDCRCKAGCKWGFSQLLTGTVASVRGLLAFLHRLRLQAIMLTPKNLWRQQQQSPAPAKPWCHNVCANLCERTARCQQFSTGPACPVHPGCDSLSSSCKPSVPTACKQAGARACVGGTPSNTKKPRRFGQLKAAMHKRSAVLYQGHEMCHQWAANICCSAV
jgi:hypothetical protein